MRERDETRSNNQQRFPCRHGVYGQSQFLRSFGGPFFVSGPILNNVNTIPSGRWQYLTPSPLEVFQLEWQICHRFPSIAHEAKRGDVRRTLGVRPLEASRPPCLPPEERICSNLRKIRQHDNPIFRSKSVSKTAPKSKMQEFRQLPRLYNRFIVLLRCVA